MFPTTCPTDDRLCAFDQGDLPEAELDGVAGHLRDCPACVARLGRLAVPVGAFAGSREEVPPEIQGDSAYLRAVSRSMELQAHQNRPQAGDILRDYRLQEMIGRGGMGTVFRAVHTKLDKVVALKILSGKRWNDPAAVVRFEREMKAVGRLSHPHIVRATDAGDAGGIPFLVMELIDGDNLSALVRRSGPRPVAEAIAWVRQAAVGLEHAHRNGVIHRDVKPSNLMLDREGIVKVLDLGLALPTAEPAIDETAFGESTGSPGDSNLTSASHTVGTIDYMAPEQKRNAHRVDARADVYGLGCTLWYLLTGTPPRHADFTMHTTLPGNLPPAFWDRILAVDPDQRFPGVAAAIAELDRLTAPRRSHRKRAIAAGVALAVIGATVAVLASGKRNPPQQNEQAPPQPVAAKVPLRVPPASGELPMVPEAARTLQRAWAEHLQCDVEETNSIGMRMSLVPPGEFDLAQNSRFVLSKPYLVGQTEVTHRQYAEFVVQSGYLTDVERLGNGQRVIFVAHPNGLGGGTRSQKNRDFNWRNTGWGTPGDNDPVTQISWNDANAFCHWLSKKENRTYRLPSEAEWVWAARAGVATEWYPENFPDTAKRPDYPAMAAAPMRPDPVRSGPSNAWNLSETDRNLEEWCHDWLGQIPPGRQVDYVHEVKNPAGLRLLKGGSFATRAFGYNVRTGYPPDAGRTIVGFRVICETP
jgi:eukaryotic-like serine/threonine-protein kinase